MPRLKPYLHWDREHFLEHCLDQVRIYAPELEQQVIDAIVDTRWNPMQDYDGCTFVQDKFHPYVPCLIHDYAWKVLGGGKEHDIEFRNNLIRFGTKKSKANFYYLAVRLGWIVYFKWNKK